MATKMKNRSIFKLKLLSPSGISTVLNYLCYISLYFCWILWFSTWSPVCVEDITFMGTNTKKSCISPDTYFSCRLASVCRRFHFSVKLTFFCEEMSKRSCQRCIFFFPLQNKMVKRVLQQHENHAWFLNFKSIMIFFQSSTLWFYRLRFYSGVSNYAVNVNLYQVDEYKLFF